MTVPTLACYSLAALFLNVFKESPVAGHSKWANIKFRKALVDAKRGKIFTRLIKEITVAARLGGGDPGSNARLRTAIDKAYDNNMAKDNVERAVKRGTGELEGISYEEVTYEGYGPSGVAIMVETMTDNKVRTVAEIRHIFSKRGGNLGQDGSVGYLFKKRGLLVFDKATVDEDRLIEAALEAGADDVVSEDEQFSVYTDPAVFSEVKAALQAAGLKALEAEVTMLPETRHAVSGDDAERLLKLLDALEENDDVQNVYSNEDISEEEMQRLQG